jgi:hypothetical protein
LKLNEIKNFIKENNIEKKYNESLNYNKINSIKNSFFSSELVSDFYETNQEMSYINYYYYLSEKINNNEHFIKYLDKKTDEWLNKDNKLDKKEAMAYLLKTFVINPVDGKLKEISVKNKIKEKFSNFSIAEPTGKQDVEECWDLKIFNENICFYLQVKPQSFFNSIKGTSKHSFQKIQNASIKYDNPIFLTNEKQEEVYIYIRDKKNFNKCKFIPLSNFKIENLNQDKIKLLANTTFKNISSSINKNKFKK